MDSGPGRTKGRIKDHARRWEHFADLRASGELNAQGERVAKPHGAIRWRADEDKMGREWIAPISAKVRLALTDFGVSDLGLASRFRSPALWILRSR